VASPFDRIVAAQYRQRAGLAAWRHGLIDWEKIVREHGRPAYQTAWRILGNAADTDDAVQEAMLDALRLARQQKIDNWSGLLRRLTACRALDLLRKRWPRRLEEEPNASPMVEPSAVAVGNELARRLRVSLAELAPREAEVFALRYFGELSNAEIAATLDVKLGAVAVALHKARTRLTVLLGVDEDERSSQTQS
jgi:RNA polymerase sigma-70 factor, ECF subfamily